MPAVLLSEHRCRSYVGDRRLELIVPATDDIAFTIHHGAESGLGDVCGIVLLALPNFRVEHIGSLEKICFGRARHQARDRHAAIGDLGSEGERERVEERLAGVVDGLIRAGNEACDRADDENPALSASSHASTKAMNETDRPGDVGVHDMDDVVEILIQKALSETSPGVGEQGVDWPITDHTAQLVDTFDRREVACELTHAHDPSRFEAILRHRVAEMPRLPEVARNVA